MKNKPFKAETNDILRRGPVAASRNTRSWSDGHSIIMKLARLILLVRFTVKIQERKSSFKRRLDTVIRDAS